MDISPPTVEEIKGVLKGHPGETLNKKQIAIEIAQSRLPCANSTEVDEAAAVLRDYLEAMRLRDIPKVVCNSIN